MGRDGFHFGVRVRYPYTGSLSLFSVEHPTFSGGASTAVGLQRPNLER